MPTAPEILRQRAREYRAIGEEHREGDAPKGWHEAIELLLEELADAIERAAELEREAA